MTLPMASQMRGTPSFSRLAPPSCGSVQHASKPSAPRSSPNETHATWASSLAAGASMSGKLPTTTFSAAGASWMAPTREAIAAPQSLPPALASSTTMIPSALLMAFRHASLADVNSSDGTASSCTCEGKRKSTLRRSISAEKMPRRTCAVKYLLSITSLKRKRD